MLMNKQRVSRVPPKAFRLERRLAPLSPGHHSSALPPQRLPGRAARQDAGLQYGQVCAAALRRYRERQSTS